MWMMWRSMWRSGGEPDVRMPEIGMSDAGMSTAEYAVGTIAAAAFAAVLYAVVTGSSVVSGLGALVQRALAVKVG
jgi:hypothetical protein